ncbi:MAG: hypothetical protein DWQ09_18130 [Proteobacteria bacterium]|nr:MAG: hypothetical protein DWQ09_18130 [Pseudomonadota bacterium]QKK11908.1 MAG: hypothetical protein HND59_10250 [Pseudomonadota bacterium]
MGITVDVSKGACAGFAALAPADAACNVPLTEKTTKNIKNKRLRIVLTSDTGVPNSLHITE